MILSDKVIFIILFLITLNINKVACQDIQYGINLSNGLARFDNREAVNSYNIEIGGYLNKFVTKKWKLQIGGNLGFFSKISNEFRFIDPSKAFNFTDTILQQIEGVYNYEGVFVSIPVRLIYFSPNIKRIGIIIGTKSILNLKGNIETEFKIVERNRYTSEVLKQSDTIKQTSSQRFFNIDILTFGFQLDFGKIKIIPLLGLGSHNFEPNSVVLGIGRVTYSLELNWNLKRADKE